MCSAMDCSVAASTAKPCRRARLIANAGTAWLWHEKQARCLGYSSAPAFTSKGMARETDARNKSRLGSFPGADGSSSPAA